MANEDRNNTSLEFHLFNDCDDILVTHNRFIRAKFRRVLNDEVFIPTWVTKVSEVQQGGLQCVNGETWQLDEILWVTSASAQTWLGRPDLMLTEHGFVKVGDTLESISHPGIFVAGDVAHVVNHPRPKSGVFAVRQDRRCQKSPSPLLGQTLKAFSPQKQFLSLISTGDKYAVASRSWWALEGRWVWVWKDWIDRKFMRKFNQAAGYGR